MQRIKEKIFNRTTIKLVVIIILISLYGFYVMTEREKRKNFVMNEYQTIIHPSGLEQTKITIFTRFAEPKVALSVYFKYDDTIENLDEYETYLISYYEKELIKKGWVKKSVRQDSKMKYPAPVYVKEKWTMILYPEDQTFCITID